MRPKRKLSRSHFQAFQVPKGERKATGEGSG
jgi:hypothetical protein